MPTPSLASPRLARYKLLRLDPGELADVAPHATNTALCLASAVLAGRVLATSDALRAAAPRVCGEDYDAADAAAVLDKMDARERQLHRTPTGDGYTDIMRALDVLLETHGMETIRNAVDEIAADYLNTGDSYAATIVFEHATGRFTLDDWATAATRLRTVGSCPILTPDDVSDADPSALADTVGEAARVCYLLTDEEVGAIEWIGDRYAVASYLHDALYTGMSGSWLDIDPYAVAEALASDGVDRVPCLSEDTALAVLVWTIGAAHPADPDDDPDGDGYNPEDDEIEGTYDLVAGAAYVTGDRPGNAPRNPDDPDRDGGTRMHWDGQTTVRTPGGHPVYFTRDGATVAHDGERWRRVSVHVLAVVDYDGDDARPWRVERASDGAPAPDDAPPASLADAHARAAELSAEHGTAYHVVRAVPASAALY